MQPELAMEYDDSIIGKRTNFSDEYFGKDKVTNSENAIDVIRYAFTTYLRWSPDAIDAHMTKKLMEDLHLQPLMKYINYPIGYDKNKDYCYLVSLVFRGYNLNVRERTIHVYENILNGSQMKYQKDYFSGTEGAVRAGICLQYMINHYIIFSDLNELYYIFGSNDGFDAIKKYKLMSPCMEIFESPLDFLVFILPKEQRIPLYHNYYKFKYLTKMRNEKGRRQHTDCDYKLEVGNYENKVLR